LRQQLVTRHIIFDCDGVLVDSEPLSMRADVTLMRRFGIEISEAEAHRRFVGTTFQAMLDEVARQHNVIFPPGLSDEKDALLTHMFHAELKAVEGLDSVLPALRDRGFSFSVASNSPRERVELALALAGIRSFMDQITTFEDVVNGKPAPDVFNLALERSGVGPDECVVIEDSVTGVTASVSANLQTLGFTGTHDDPVAHGARLMQIGAKPVFHRMAALPQLI
jgi:HAD superfamily hydrolase (TIGR01509 family)